MLQLLTSQCNKILKCLSWETNSAFNVSKGNPEYDPLCRGHDYLAKEKCDSTLPCGVCRYNTSKTLTLKGLCFDELRKEGDFDTEYFVSGLINERLHFRYCCSDQDSSSQREVHSPFPEERGRAKYFTTPKTAHGRCSHLRTLPECQNST